MKVAMIGLRGIPAKSGGVETVVEHLAPELVKLGIDVTVYCRNPYCKERPKSYKGVHLRYLPTINTKFTEAIVHSFLATMHAVTKDYDVIHYHAMGNALFSVIPRLFGKRTVVTLHGLDWQREKWGLLAKTYLRFSEWVITKVPNDVVSVSRKVQKYYKVKYGKKISYVPNGVDSVNTVPLETTKRFDIKKGKYVLFLSRIVPEKGLHFLVKAFAGVKGDVKLLVVGDATHTDDYMKKVKGMAKDERIIFAGPLYGKEKAEAFSNAAFFVLPSTIEGMPVVVLESLSYGTCPLVSNIEENLDLIEQDKYGYSFTSEHVQDLRKQLQWMIFHSAECSKKGIAGKRKVRKDYKWSAIAEQYLPSYHE